MRTIGTSTFLSNISLTRAVIGGPKHVPRALIFIKGCLVTPLPSPRSNSDSSNKTRESNSRWRWTWRQEGTEAFGNRRVGGSKGQR